MSLRSLIASGTKLWLDSVDPVEVARNRAIGATGATSNPIIIADIIKTGSYDDQIIALHERGMQADEIAWDLTDQLVRRAEAVFLPVWEESGGDNGYVSFELDPLLEDTQEPVPHEERVARYKALGKLWARGHKNRMIKVPATAAGLESLEHLAASGVTLNVTLIFTRRQYERARDAIWRGAQQRGSLDGFKSVYSIFVSRVDVYTDKHVPDLSPQAKGMVGIVNAKQMWRLNQDFWRDKALPLKQEIIFASTGTKRKEDPPDKYVEALAGSDIQTNPPGTNQAVEELNKTYTRQVDQLPPQGVLDEIERKVDQQKLEEVLVEEGTKKFADPQKALLQLIEQKRAELTKA